MNTSGRFATARRGGIDYSTIAAIRARLPRAGAQAIAAMTGASVEDVRALLSGDR